MHFVILKARLVSIALIPLLLFTAVPFLTHYVFQAEEIQNVTATAASEPVNYDGQYLTMVSWTVHGKERSGLIKESLQKGDVTEVSVDSRGNLAEDRTQNFSVAVASGAFLGLFASFCTMMLLTDRWWRINDRQRKAERKLRYTHNV